MNPATVSSKTTMKKISFAEYACALTTLTLIAMVALTIGYIALIKWLIENGYETPTFIVMSAFIAANIYIGLVRPVRQFHKQQTKGSK